MQERHSFEYAIIRLVPQVEREEFLNAGVILYCRQHRFLQMKFFLDEKRIQAIFPAADIADIRCHLEAFEQISAGSPQAGPIATLDMPSRFRWLTAKRSTIIQTSQVHPGLCSNPTETLQRLFEQLVLT
ncbi:MAG: DUF3037 domain-containing protein [Ferruginibacter sp.]